MNRSDLVRVARNMDHTLGSLRKHGDALWLATFDWQSSLRSGADGRRPKGDPSDPTYAAALSVLQGLDRGLETAHDDYRAAIERLDVAVLEVAARFRQLMPVDKDDPGVHRGRVNSVASCIVCTGPAFPVRRGMCDADYRAWLRADRPDLTRFKRDRQRAVEAAQARIHEHEVA